jgi:pyruvate dehydrogenase E1 component alpha subunit
MIAELYGKVTGCCRGRGGSMHLVDTSCGFIGASAIVGNSIPIGVGAAFAHKLNQDDGVTFIFLGDGATEEGVFYESLNFAVVQHLPAVFLCENNLYSVYTNLKSRQPMGRRITDLAGSIGARVQYLMCNDPVQMYRELSVLVENTRLGEGPLFIEVPTYRWLEHCGPFDDDDLGYRPLGELSSQKLSDPLTLLLGQLKSFNHSNLNEKLEIFNINLKNEIDEVFLKAMDDPFPDLNDVMGGVYAE